MNKHFRDSLYYLKRAGEHARLGVRDAIGRAESRVRRLTGREVEPETRIDRVRSELTKLGDEAEVRAREVLEEARTTVNERRLRSGETN